MYIDIGITCNECYDDISTFSSQNTKDSEQNVDLIFTFTHLSSLYELYSTVGKFNKILWSHSHSIRKQSSVPIFIYLPFNILRHALLQAYPMS